MQLLATKRVICKLFSLAFLDMMIWCSICLLSSIGLATARSIAIATPMLQTFQESLREHEQLCLRLESNAVSLFSQTGQCIYQVFSLISLSLSHISASPVFTLHSFASLLPVPFGPSLSFRTPSVVSPAHTYWEESFPVPPPFTRPLVRIWRVEKFTEIFKCWMSHRHQLWVTEKMEIVVTEAKEQNCTRSGRVRSRSLIHHRAQILCTTRSFEAIRATIARCCGILQWREAIISATWIGLCFWLHAWLYACCTPIFWSFHKHVAVCCRVLHTHSQSHTLFYKCTYVFGTEMDENLWYRVAHSLSHTHILSLCTHSFPHLHTLPRAHTHTHVISSAMDKNLGCRGSCVRVWVC